MVIQQPRQAPIPPPGARAARRAAPRPGRNEIVKLMDELLAANHDPEPWKQAGLKPLPFLDGEAPGLGGGLGDAEGAVLGLEGRSMAVQRGASIDKSPLQNHDGPARWRAPWDSSCSEVR